MLNPYGQRKRPRLNNEEEPHATKPLAFSEPLNLMPTSCKRKENDDDSWDSNECDQDPNTRDQFFLVGGCYNNSRDEFPSHQDWSRPSNGQTASEQASALVIAASDKAGMSQIDRTRIDEIILRESGNSLYIQQQKRRDQKVNERIELMKRKLYEQEERMAASKLNHHTTSPTRATRNATNKDWKRQIEDQLDSEMDHWLQQRRSHSTVVVVDMDMFYMACELLTLPDLRNKPACVGKGVILTSNYCARKYGVRSALAGWIGDALVHELSGGQEQLHHVPANFKLYQLKSDQVKSALAEYDPHLRSYSLDEAYLDIGPYLALKLTKGWPHDQIKAALAATSSVPESAAEASTDTASDRKPSDDDVESMDASSTFVDSLLSAYNSSRVEEILSSFPPETCLESATQILSELRRRVFEVTDGLTCSAGMAPNVMLAKMASDCNKPNGQVVVGPTQTDVLAFLHPMPTRKVPGIGRVTEKILRAFDIIYVQDLFQQRALVKFLFQPATARFLWIASLGCSSSDVPTAAFGNSTPDLEDTEGDDDEKKNSKVAASAQKGISKERTFASGRPWSELSARLEEITRGLSADMKRKNIWAKTITVKAKLHTFDILSRSKTLADNMLLHDPADMVRLAAELLRELKVERKGQSFSVRLLGVRCSNFATEKEKALALTMKQTCLSMERFALHQNSTDDRSIPTGQNVSIKNTDCLTTTSSIVNNMKATKSEQQRHMFQRIVLPSKAETRESIGVVASTTASDALVEQCVPCPVCGVKLLLEDNESLNRHLDSCLNSSLVRAAVREESQDKTKFDCKATRRGGIADFFK